MANWVPVFSPASETAVLAWNAINAITQSVIAPDDQLPTPERYRRHTYEEALLYGYLAVAHDDLEWANRATECVNRVIDHTSQAGYLGLFGGLTGLGWSVEHLSNLLQQVSDTPDDPDSVPALHEAEAEDDGEDLNAEIDSAILRALPYTNSSSPYDLISGLVGFGIYFLERLPRANAAQGIKAVFDRLESLAEKKDGGIAWYSKAELLPDWQREDCPNGYYNLGVAHGIPGVIHFLSEVSAKRIVEQDRCNLLLLGAVDWLMAQQRPRGSLSRFSSWVVPGQESTDSRLAWCYGDLGILAVLLQVARPAGRSDLRQFAHELLDHCLAWPPEAAGIGDAPLCHGAAGVAHIFNRIYQSEGDPRCLEAARYWYERTLAMRRPGTGVGGYLALTRPDRGGPIIWQASPAFLDGALGVALALLAAVTPIEPGWDRMLLLSGKAT